MPFSKSQQKKLRVLGVRVKAARNDRGLSLQQLAHAIGKDRQSIHRLEMGGVNPSYLYLQDVCAGLGMSISELLAGLDE